MPRGVLLQARATLAATRGALAQARGALAQARGPVATTLILQPDDAAALDLFIYSSAPTSNFNSSGLGIGDDGSGVYRSLIKFDLSALPSNAAIISATLSLFCYSDVSTTARTFRVFRLKRAWSETQATWNRYAAGLDWQTPGGFGADDCEQTDIGSRAFTATETLNEFKDFPLTPTTKAALDLGNGFMVKGDVEVSDGYFFRAAEFATADLRPKLTIVYIG